ncbi:cation:H+ antiporter [Cognatiyoonia koreensis]|uniref:Cation:H+ antiporter n=1 Tax=Cognatiyoonia koreensis TaxID=364200 RepID=A0A1I0QHS2_9RHOB|nr:cation:H+ antiporter [Cognatiyoonia koreensis]
MPDTTLLQSLGLFAVSAAIVWFAGTRLAYLADALADRFNLAKSLVGLLLLALATSLPEVATTLSAAVSQAKALVLNNLFGGIAFQTAILALSDLWARGAITNYPRKANHALEATLLVFLLAIALLVIEVGEPIAVAGIGMGSVLIALIYGGAIWLLRRYDGENDWIPVDLPDEVPETFPVSALLAGESRAMLWQAGAACLAILVFGVLLVTFAERIASQSGLGTSFIGVTLLAAATSLPELTTSITAVRIGAYTMAISNIFGSNLIMLVLIFPADMLFRSGPILQNTSQTVRLALLFGIAVTAIYLTGLIVRRKPTVGPFGLDSIIVLAVVIGSGFAYYAAR